MGVKVGKKLIMLFVLISSAIFLGWTSQAQASVVDSASISLIGSSDIQPFPSPVPSGSGLGTLDLVLISGATKNNSSGSHNYDDGNSDMANGSTTTTNESYVTSIGDLRDFYNYQFPSTPINEVVLFVNINETGGVKDFSLDTLDVVTGYTTP